ncbi:uncharacterized protein LOC135390018 [Ornithodoros turicata]|uniref:uncharacterized protein LOC135390018 n=1 Tax=Ornithodoros turicata TaxID=34597 RepID=UPI00313899AC
MVTLTDTSDAEPSETGATPSPTEAPAGTRRRYVKLVLGGIALVALGSLITALALNSAYDTEGAEEEEVLASDDGGFSIDADSYASHLEKTTTEEPKAIAPDTTDDKKTMAPDTTEEKTMAPDTTTVIPTSENTIPSSTTVTSTTDVSEKYLLCTISYVDEGIKDLDGICDILVCDIAAEEIGSLELSGNALAVAAFANSTNKTEVGLNFVNPEATYAILKAKGHRKDMLYYVERNFAFFGTFNSTVTRSTRDLSLVKKFLLELRRQTGNSKGRRQAFIFWGVSVLPHTKANISHEVFRRNFLSAIQRVNPRILVYQTSLYNSAECVSTGPTVWRNSPTPLQPSMMELLNFRKVVKLPKQTMEMMTFSLCGVWTEFSPEKRPTEIGIKSGCKQTVVSGLEPYVCRGGLDWQQYKDILDHQRQLHVSANLNGTWIVGYDLRDTMEKKMCMATVDFKFTGSWAVHSLECGFKKLCADADFPGSYPRVKMLKHFLHHKFAKCLTK